MKIILLMAALLISMPALSESTAVNGWTYKKETNKLTDKTDFFSGNRSIDFYSKDGIERFATLIIRCSSNETDLYISVDDYLGSSSPSIVIRLDDGKPMASKWIIGEKGNSAFARKPINLIKDLVKHKKLVIGFEPYGATMKALEFDLTGVDVIAKDVSEACGWKI